MLVKMISNAMDTFIFHYHSTLEGQRHRCDDNRTLRCDVHLYDTKKIAMGTTAEERSCKAIEITDGDFFSFSDDVAKSLELDCSILRYQLQELSRRERSGANASSTIDCNFSGVALIA